MIKKALILNSGGKDSKKVIEDFIEEYPDIELHLLTIETNSEEANKEARDQADNMNLTFLTHPFKSLQSQLPSPINPLTAIPYWGTEIHMRGMHYAYKNGYDIVLSGHTNYYTKIQYFSSKTLDEFLLEMFNFLHEDSTIELQRPLREMTYRDLQSLKST